MKTPRAAMLASLAVLVLPSLGRASHQAPGFDGATPPGERPPFVGVLDQLRRQQGGLPPLAGRPAYGRALEEFYFVEEELLRWDREYRAAPSGSWREREADARRREAYDRGLRLVSDPGALRGSGPAELERFALEMTRKYQAAPSGSLAEALYNSARRSAWQAFEEETADDLRRGGGWDRLVRDAEEFDSRYQRASSGSLEEAAFQRLRRTAWDEAYAALERDLRYGRSDFREAEPLAEDFSRQYQSASSGSLRESFFNRARRLAFDGAFDAFQRDLYRLSPHELDSLEREYDSRYQRASSGSLAESYFRRVRDLIRSRIGYRPRW